MKRQLNVAIVISDIVEVLLKMSHLFCNDNVTVAVEDHRHFSMRKIPDRRVFSKVFYTLHESNILSSFITHVSSERGKRNRIYTVQNIHIFMNISA